jgi:hypothetical protein
VLIRLKAQEPNFKQEDGTMKKYIALFATFVSGAGITSAAYSTHMQEPIIAVISIAAAAAGVVVGKSTFQSFVKDMEIDAWLEGYKRGILKRLSK